MLKKAVVLIIGLALLVSAVQAKGPAIVTTGSACDLIASDGINTFLTTTSKEVIKEGNKVTITCRGILPEGTYPDKAVHLDYANTGFEFDYGYGVTRDWKEVITPSGQVTLKIKFDLKTKP